MKVKLRVLIAGTLFLTGGMLMAQEKAKKPKDTIPEEKIGEVVIIGNIKLDPAQKVGSYNVVSKANFESTPFSSVDEVLNGRVAGLNFSAASGDPGSSNMVIIRGVSSLTGTPNPLYVIDGVVIGKGADNASMMESWNPLAVIDPNSIESVSVLKDASSTALYGSRGANGVIIIKTKRGKFNQKTRFEFSTETGIQDRAFDKLKMMNGDEYIKYGGILMWNSQGYPNTGIPTFNNMEEATQYYLDKYIIPNYVGSNPFTGEEAPAENLVETKRYVDWLDQITRNSSMVTTYNFGASGGGENTSFRFGASYYNNEPLIKSSSFDRISVDAAVDHKASEKLRLGFNASYSNVKRHTYNGGRATSNPVTTGIMNSPLRPVYNLDGTYNQSEWSPETDMTATMNVVGLMANSYQEAIINTFIASANADYNFAKNLYFNSLFGTQAQFMKEVEVIGKGYRVFTTTDDNYGYLLDARTNIFDWNWSNTLGYRNIFADKHNLEVYAGMEYQNHTYNMYGGSSLYMTDPRPYFQYALIDTNHPVNYVGNDLEWTQISYFGRLNYTYSNRYTVSGQIRRDGNSTLGRQKWGNFWSAGVSWNIKNESFTPKLFSSLNLRASYGVLGNIPYADQWGDQYNQFPTYVITPSDGNWGGNQSTVGFGNPGNPDLRWEEAKHLDVGLDLGFFNDRLKFAMDYYDKYTVDAIFDFPTAQETGGSPTYLKNSATLHNYGFEVVVDAIPVQTENFKWSINANAAYSKTMVDKYDGNVPWQFQEDDTSGAGNAFATVFQGHVLGEFWGVEYAGTATENHSDPNPLNSYTVGEALFYLNETGDEVTSNRAAAANRWFGKSSFPVYNVGLTNTFNYKNWSLSFMLSGQFDFYVQNAVRSYTIHNGMFPVRNQVVEALYDSWTDAPGYENFNASNPKAILGDPKVSRLESSRFFSKGDHIRLKEIKLAYSFGNIFKESTGINNLTVYLRGTNLLTWVFDKNLNYDPESNSNAWSWLGKGRYWYSSPVMRTMAMGIQIGF
ncbi:MAG: SusC/RagA family TonB-linked outer membrane protein [Flavobacteriaceae bacterium]|nr:SusC/RagA family TonB-linked outer membrane protein [Flavobacteriaceae bacterium]